MITADKVFKGNTEILKIFKGINLEWEKVIPIPSADAYVQKGLVFQLDGIDKGNVEGAWVDRKAGRQFTLNNCIVNSDNIQFNGTDSSAVYNQLLDFGTTTTVEVVFTREKVFGTIISSGDKVQLIALQENDGYKYRYFSGNQVTGIVFPDPTAIHTLSIPTSGRPVLDQIAQPKTFKDFYTVSDTTHTYVGGNPSYSKGKIYSIRIYNRNLTSAEMMKNQMIDIERFNIPGYETVNLTIEGNDGTPMTGARFAFLGNQYVYDGKPVTLKVPKGTYYQIDFSCVPDYAACEFLGTYVAEENNVRNLKAIYTYDGWGDYFVSNVNFDGSIAEVRDGVTYYKKANSSSLMCYGDVKVYHYPNNENFDIQFGNTQHAANSVETVPHIYTGSFTSGIYNNSNSANSQTFYNIVYLNSIFYINGVTYTGTARRFGSLNSNASTKLEANRGYKNYISPIEVAAGRGYLQFSDSYYSRVSDIDTLIIGPHDRDYNIGSVFSISVEKKFNVNRIPNLLQIYSFKHFDLSDVTFKSKEGLIETLITNSLDRSALDSVSITLNSSTKELLTSDEIAQITSKGYTIA